MEKIIEDMICSAYQHMDYEMAAMTYKIMSKLATTINCPSDWREIGSNMYGKFRNNDWLVENCNLYDFE